MTGRGFMSVDASRKVAGLGRKIVRFAVKLAVDEFKQKPLTPPGNAPCGCHMDDAHEVGNLIAQAIMGGAMPDDGPREGDDGAYDYATSLFFASGMAFAIGAFLATVPIDQQEATIALIKEQIDRGQVDFTHTMFRPNA